MATVEYSLIGIWEILKSSGTEDFDGIKFRLDEMGELIWFDPVRNEPKDSVQDSEKSLSSCSISDSTINVLFCCETYEINNSFTKIVFSTYTGQCLEFETKTYFPEEIMTLTHDTGLFLKCQKTKDDQSIEQGLAYSLIYALKDSNFSDITLKSIDNVIFHIHSSILRLNGFDSSSNYDFELSTISYASNYSPTRAPPSSPLTPLSVLWNLPSGILSAILHWLYSESLPYNMTEEMCEKLIAMSSIPPLSKMLEPCRKYLNNIKFKKFLIDIIMSMHELIDHINEKIQSPISSSSSLNSPSNLYHVFKQVLTDLAVICSKLLQFCYVYVRDTADFSRLQRNEIIKFIRSRLPIFISQSHRLFQNIYNVLCQLTTEEKADLATYLVPEVKLAMFEIIDVLQKLRDDLKLSKTEEQHSSSIAKSQKFFESKVVNASAAYETSSIFFLYMYELKKNGDVYGYVTTALEIIEHKSTLFNEMSFSNQQQTIKRNLENMIAEIPKIIDRLSGSIDDKIGWKEFKFFFKFSTNQVSGIIFKLLEKRATIESFVQYLCTLVQNDLFTNAMCELTFLPRNGNIDDESSQATERDPKINYDSYRFNLFQHLCESPPTANSYLARNSLRLLHSGHLSDMVFEIVTNIADGHNNSPSLLGPDSEISMTKEKENVHIYRAHRVIVASRCEWFKKALISGMKEDINRKIVIHDTSPVIFRRLLLYLYGGPVDKSVNIEQICELMLLADRFSLDNLKEICEIILISSIDKESVVYLLGIGDRFNALALKTSCLSFITQHIAITKTEIFDELPSILKTEVQELIHWYGRIPEPWNDNRASYQMKSPSKSAAKANIKSKKSTSSLM